LLGKLAWVWLAWQVGCGGAEMGDVCRGYGVGAGGGVVLMGLGVELVSGRVQDAVFVEFCCK